MLFRPALVAISLCLFAATALLPVQADTEHVAADLPEINIVDGFADLVDAVKPAVVNISVTGSVTSPIQRHGFRNQSPELEEFFKRFFGDQFEMPEGGDKPFERKTTAVGSGFVVGPEGLVVTNHHVIEDADEIEVVFDDGTRVPARLKGTDTKTDIALLELEGSGPYPYVQFGDSEIARVGDWVVAIGNPFGLGGTTTKGIISARGRDIRSGPLDDFIQIDAPINRGNSGGPLFNMKGEVIGINSAIFSPNGGSVGIGFAIPSAMASNVINQLKETGTVQRGYLGVQIQTVTEDIADSLGLDNARGALVTQVIEDSPAEAAGLEAGDIILEFDGNEIKRMRELPKIVALTEKDKEVEVAVWRNEEEKIMRVSVGGNSDGASSPVAAAESRSPEVSKLGLKLEMLDDAAREKYQVPEESSGVLVVGVNPDSPAAERGMAQGEVITKVGNSDVSSPDDVESAIGDAVKQSKKSVLLLVERAGRVRYVAIPLGP